MKRFVEGEDRRQVVLLPHCLDDYVTENNPVRVIEAFIDELAAALGVGTPNSHVKASAGLVTRFKHL